MLFCPVCDNEVTVHHEKEGVCFLSCGHTARYNPMPNAVLEWHGLKDGEPFMLHLADRKLVPAGDMKTADTWKIPGDYCPTCGAVAVEVGGSFQADGAHIKFACGHEMVR